jgi:hypothetical protein
MELTLCRSKRTGGIITNKKAFPGNGGLTPVWQGQPRLTYAYIASGDPVYNFGAFPRCLC